MQDYPRIEVIIADDGSENFDKKFIENLFSKSGKNIVNLEIIHHEKNIGTVRNLNNAIKKSNGNYFIGLAADDMYYDNQTVSKIIRFFKETKAYVVTSKRAVFEGDKRNVREVLPSSEDEIYLYKNPEILFRRLCIGNFISGACTFYSRKCFEKYGLFDESYVLLEDYPYYLRLTRIGVKIDYLRLTTILYRWGGISTSGKHNKLLLSDFKTSIVKEVFPFLSKEDPLYPFVNDILLSYDWHSANGMFEKFKVIKNNHVAFLKKLFRKIKRNLNKNSDEKLRKKFRDYLKYIIEEPENITGVGGKDIW